MARLLCLLSPAKTLDLSAPAVRACSQPTLLEDAHELVKQLQKLSQAKLKALLGVSDALAKLNHDRFQSFKFVDAASDTPEPNTTFKQAVLAFNGPAYLGLAAADLSAVDLKYAQDHLAILCGLYGVLRPLDLIQPYRLEMGQRFANDRGKDLYAFWGDSIAHQLNGRFRQGGDDHDKILVNVASQEYFKSVKTEALDADVRVVDCVFLDDGKVKSAYAKRARGLMCRYLLQNRVDSLDGIRKFDLEGYSYSAGASSDDTFVFTRSVARAKAAVNNIREMAKNKTAATGKAKKEEKASKRVKEEKEEKEEEPPLGLRRSARKKHKSS